MAAGARALVGFIRLQRTRERSGGIPLIDPALLRDRIFVTGVCATFCFFLANLGFYFVLAFYLQNGLGFAPLDAALTVMPLAFAFVAGSRLSGRHLIKGCILQTAGLTSTAVVVSTIAQPSMLQLALPLVLVGYGQGMVLAPLFGEVLAQVHHTHAGAGAGILTTTQQVANATGVALTGAVYFAVAAVLGDRWALVATMALLACALAATVGFLRRMGAAAPAIKPVTASRVA
jgi:predicted MFS family arabinose efflux permease